MPDGDYEMEGNEDTERDQHTEGLTSDEDPEAFYAEEDEDVASRSEPFDVINEIRGYAIMNKITHRSGNDLLRRFRKWFPTLPRDIRTIVDTIRDVALQEMAPGKYFHCGLAHCIFHSLKSSGIRALGIDCVDLLIGIDGPPN